MDTTTCTDGDGDADRRAEAARTVGRANVPFSVKTLAGQSAPITVTYAGVPNVTVSA